MRSFAWDLEQGRHDQRARRETAEEREAVDEFTRALAAALEAEMPPERKVLGPGWVYFIQRADGGPIKIGFTTREPGERLKQLQCGSPDPLCLLGFQMVWGISRERLLHKRFAEHRLDGEWFAPAPAILDYIDDANSRRKARGDA